MRRRDAQAILMYGASAAVLFALSFIAFRLLVASLAMTAGYCLLLWNLPRAKRIRRRMSGAVDVSGYYRN